MVGGCLAQKDRETVAERAGHVDVVFGTHNVAPRRRAAPRVRGTRAARSSRSSRRPSPTTTTRSRRRCPVRREVAVGGLGHDPDRLRQHLRLLHRARGAGQGDQPPVRRHRRRGRRPPPPTASPRSRCSARTSTATAATSPSPPARRWRPTRCGRCSPSCSGRSAPSTASAGSATRARTRRTCAPRRSPPWPSTPAVCEHLHLPAAVGQRPRAGRHAPRLHGRALPRAPRGGPGRHRRPRGHHRHHRRVPRARPTTTSSAPSRWWPRPRTTAPTRSSSAPGPAPRPPSVVDELRARRGGGGALRAAARSCVERSGLARHEARVGRVEEVLVEGPSPQGPGGAHRSHPAEQARALRRRPAIRPGTYATVRVTGAAPAPPAGRARRRRHGRATHKTRLPLLVG